MSQNWLNSDELHHAILDCVHCQVVFLHPQAQTEWVCPMCGNEQFLPVDFAEADELVYSPELIVRHKESLPFAERLEKFRRSVIIPPADLKADTLLARRQLLYWPMWLVDVDVTARWQAEVGYDYKAVTYAEKFVDKEWQSFEQKVSRIRWEQRLGELTRTYNNVSAPALDEHQDIERWLGKYALGEIRPYSAQEIQTARLLLPSRAPNDAWNEAEPHVQQNAAQECQQAASAQHIRSFKWSPQFGNQNWTQLLLPLLATYYFDDDGNKQMVYINGQTGKVVGKRKASMKLARKLSMGLGIMAGMLLLVTAVFWLIPFIIQQPFHPELTTWLMFFTFCSVLTAIAPPLIVFYVNTFRFFTEATSLESSLMRSSEAYWKDPPTT